MNYSDVDVKENAFALGSLPRTWIAGWIIAGVFMGLPSLLAAFLVEKDGPRMKRALVCAAIGLVASFIIAALFAAFVLPHVMTSLYSLFGGQVVYNVDYVGNL